MSSYYLLQFGFIYPYLTPKYHCCPYLAIFTYLWPYLALIILILAYLLLIALILPYVQYAYMSSFRTIGPLFIDILHFQDLEDTKVSSTNAVWMLI